MSKANNPPNEYQSLTEDQLSANLFYAAGAYSDDKALSEILWAAGFRIKTLAKIAARPKPGDRSEHQEVAGVDVVADVSVEPPVVEPDAGV